MSIYDSLDEYTEIGISFGRTIRIAKMTLGKTLDFDALYGYLKVLQTVEKSKIKKVWDIRDTEKEQRRVIRLGAEILLGAKYFTGIKNEPFPSVAGTWNDYGRGAVDLSYNNTSGNLDNSIKIYLSI